MISLSLLSIQTIFSKLYHSANNCSVIIISWLSMYSSTLVKQVLLQD